MEKDILVNIGMQSSDTVISHVGRNNPTYDALPTRKSPILTHLNIFRSCTPFSNCRRSLSLPKHHTFSSRLHHSRASNANTNLGFESESRSNVSSPQNKQECLSTIPIRYKTETDTTLLTAHNQTYVKPIECNKQLDLQSYQRKLENQISQKSVTTIGSYFHSCDEKSSSALLTGLTSSDVINPPSEFHDPILAELDSELPAPPPPPRACPPWLKYALSRQRVRTCPTDAKLDLNDTEFSVSSMPQISFPFRNTIKEFKENKTQSLESNRFNVRIYPVIQNGVKMSDTHYWLLDPPRSKCPTILMRHAIQCARVPSPNPSHSSELESGYMNAESNDFCPIDEMPYTGVRLKRGMSEMCKTSLQKYHQELVLRLLKQVPQATESECQAVLIGSSYNYEEAMRRLKLELLCRKGYTSRSYNRRLLAKCGWNLDQAINYARHHYEERKLRKQQQYTQLAEANLTEFPSPVRPNRGRALLHRPISSTSSDSSLSPLPVDKPKIERSNI